MSNIAIVLLAAGASRRMGQAKQLMTWQDTSLIEHQIKTLLPTGASIHIVLGAYAEKIQPLITDFSVTIHENPHWEKGMGTSLAFGVRQIVENTINTTGILITLVDQPLLTTAHFKTLIDTFTPNQQQIICSTSDKGWSGPPIIFDRCYFEELMQQDGDHGAKNVTKKHKGAITFLTLGSVLEDVDTPQAFAKAITRQF